MKLRRTFKHIVSELRRQRALAVARVTLQMLSTGCGRDQARRNWSFGVHDGRAAAHPTEIWSLQNYILKAQLKGLKLSDAERATLGEIAASSCTRSINPAASPYRSSISRPKR